MSNDGLIDLAGKVVVIGGALYVVDKFSNRPIKFSAKKRRKERKQLGMIYGKEKNMNNKGQLFALRWMTATFILFLTLGYIDSFTDTIQGVRTNLSCSLTNISTGTMITCLGLDMIQWWWIGAILVAGFGILWSKNTSQ